MTEYNVEGKTIGHGKRAGSLTLPNSGPGAKVQDSAIQKMLQAEIAAGTLPAKTANSLYFVFLPPGTRWNWAETRPVRTFADITTRPATMFFTRPCHTRIARDAKAGWRHWTP